MAEWMDDITILERLRSGEVEAFNQCYRKYRDLLMMVAMAILDNDAEAQDKVQDTFLDFWDKKQYLKVDSSLKNFLYTAIKNRCLNQLKRNEVLRRRVEEIFISSRYETPDKRMENNELGKELRAAIKEIPPKSAQVFQLAYLEHKSRNEIAEEMGISPNTVKAQLDRALKVLRSQLKNIFN